MEDEKFLTELRDQFAGQAMEAILIISGVGKINHADLASQAYIVADAMLKERTKKHQSS